MLNKINNKYIVLITLFVFIIGLSIGIPLTLKNISSDNITITNHTTGKTPLEISNLHGETQVYIDNKMGTITGFNGNNLINHSNRSWIELAKGENYLSIEGSCTVLVEAYYPIMV